MHDARSTPHSPTPFDAPNRNLSLTLARLTGDFLEFANLLADTDPSDAVATGELELLLDGSAAAIHEKAAAIAAVIREWDARADIAHTEAERIAAHERAARSRAGWLRSYLLKNLEQLGVDRIQTPTTVIAVRDSPPSVTILDEDQIPDVYKRQVTTVDKALLRRALLNHQVIDGAYLVRGRHLVMR